MMSFVCIALVVLELTPIFRECRDDWPEPIAVCQHGSVWHLYPWGRQPTWQRCVSNGTDSGAKALYQRIEEMQAD